MENNNMAEGFLDLNVLYEKKRHERALKIKSRAEEIRLENIRKREEAKKLESFKEHMRKDVTSNECDGLTLHDLKKLNSVYKREYIKIIIEDDDSTAYILDQMNHKVEDKIEEVVDI